jgi:hypothetical protein
MMSRIGSNSSVTQLSHSRRGSLRVVTDIGTLVTDASVTQFVLLSQ